MFPSIEVALIEPLKTIACLPSDSHSKAVQHCKCLRRENDMEQETAHDGSCLSAAILYRLVYCRSALVWLGWV